MHPTRTNRPLATSLQRHAVWLAWVMLAACHGSARSPAPSALEPTGGTISHEPLTDASAPIAQAGTTNDFAAAGASGQTPGAAGVEDGSSGSAGMATLPVAGVRSEPVAASPACGNGVKEAGEACDGDCPRDCDDGDACTRDDLSGAAARCDARCEHSPINVAIAGDRCCPSGANAATDSDCSPTCGNGVKEPGERCDGDCPSSCDDLDPCTADASTGSVGQCTLACAHTPITSAHAGDRCCPRGGNANTDADCKPICGNGTTEPGESCDGDCPTFCEDGDLCTRDSSTGSVETCTMRCTHAPILRALSGDGCCPVGADANRDSDCEPVCGNRVQESGELCDGDCPSENACDDGDACTKDALTGSASHCSAACSHTPITELHLRDGCCVPGGNNANDVDCPIVCGDGVLSHTDTWEEFCDPGPGSTVPCATVAICDAMRNGCGYYELEGSLPSCTVHCVLHEITERRAGDGCCPPGTKPEDDSDCVR